MAIRSPTRVSIANESAYGNYQVRKALPCKFVSSTAHSSELSFTRLVPVSLLLSAQSTWLEDEQ